MKDLNIKNYLYKLQYYYIKHKELPSVHSMKYLLNINDEKTDEIVYSLKKQSLIDNGMFLDEIVPGGDFFKFKVYKSIKAGIPSDILSDDFDMVEIKKFNFDFNPTNTLLIKVSGDSMIDYDIFNEDIIAVDTKKTVKNGDIVVALIDGEYTLKALMNDKNNRGLYLKAGNKNYADIYPKERLEIAGVYIDKVEI